VYVSRHLPSFLPRGGSLPEDEWNRRHRALVAVLWLNAVALTGYGIALGRYGAPHNVAHAASLVTCAVLASSHRFSPKLRSAIASVGLLTAAALLVHLTGGLIEAHFYFFVLVVALTLYEDWLPFLLAVGYVLLHHGIVGTLDPHAVYNRPAEWAHPWTWAGIHAVFIAFAGLAGITTWRLNENVRDRMRATQEELARISETDSLTGLANRRKAMMDLERLFAGPMEDTVLALFDLNWFKSYNDTFGHPAGDALLERLGKRFAEAVGDRATAYRLGGDEFCMLGRCREDERAALEATAAAALGEQGQAFRITASYGSVLIPVEASSPSDALLVADQRMYARKHSSRPSAISQSKGVLVQAILERHPDLGGHLGEVARLVEPVAKRLAMPAVDIEVLRDAAELHDIGKVAIPDAIITKPGPLTPSEREFIERHTLIGQRIVAAAPVLAGVGELIRSSHERWDGDGYPDELSGAEIPLGARIIAVCDAYDAMTADRPHRRALARPDALAELRRCAGTQFDPRVVDAFLAVVSEPRALKAVEAVPINGSVASTAS
jgi:diguanylate cyclase (GGDEF)-like protein